MQAPQTRYARSGDVNVAYQVLGDGPLDLVYVWGWVSHLDFMWIEPRIAAFLQRLASFSRVPGEWHLYVITSDRTAKASRYSATVPTGAGAGMPPRLGDRAVRRLARSAPGLARAAARSLSKRPAR